MYELIELTELELDAVSGGNPFSNNFAASLTATVNTTISAAFNSAFTNSPALAQANTSNQSVNISGP